MPIAAGKLRHRVRLMRPEAPGTDIRDANGQPNGAPVIVDTVWAAIQPISGREGFVAQQIQVQATHTVMIRYRGDLGSRWWFEYDDPGAGKTRIMQIEAAIDPDERREFLNCFCDEREATN